MLIVNLSGVALIAITIWWFWLYKPAESVMNDAATVIIVENGTYQPARIKLEANKPTELHFLRKDSSPCSEIVMLPDLEISESLPLDTPKVIHLPPLEKGDYAFHCQMQMYRGVIKVS